MREYKYQWRHLRSKVEGFCYIKCDSLEHFIANIMKMQAKDKGVWEYWV